MASLTFSMFNFVLLFLTSTSLATSVPSRHTSLIYQFPNGTWLENLAVRPDGSLLTTVITTPDLYLVQPNPSRPDPKLIYQFNDTKSLLGITETTPDTYYVAATNFTVETRATDPGSSKIYRVSFPDYNSSEPSVSLTANLPDVSLPNGLTTLNNHTILVADSVQGRISAIDTDTGVVNVVISDPLLTGDGLGVNGLKVRGHTLFFTNTNQNIFGRVDVDLNTGVPTGPASVIARYPSAPTDPPLTAYDDFALSKKGDVAYLTTARGNSVTKVHIESGTQKIIAGGVNSTEIAQPTAAQLGRNGMGDTLFVVTAGRYFAPLNVGGSEVVGGQVLALKVGEGH